MSSVETKTEQKWSFIDIAIAVVGVAMAMYHLISTQYLIFGGYEHQNAHLGFALVLIFLVAIKEGGKKNRLIMPVLIVLSLACVVYVGMNVEALQLRVWFNTTLDIIVGITIVILVIEATRQSFGLILPVLTVVFIIYAFFGHYIPGPLGAANVPILRIISSLAIGLSGIYGQVLAISANFIFLFVLFGAILQTSGATVFFEHVGRLAGRKIAAGPAISSVVTSALVGTTTGSVGANIATTGSFTIPLMKKAGYKPEEAGAIEAAASTGGQIMPPVMGAAAFAMAGVTGIPYLTIVVVAIIPAVIYFLVLGLYAISRANRMGIKAQMGEVDYREMLLRAPLFFIPLAAIVYTLIIGKTLMYAAFCGIVSAIILSLLRKQTRNSLVGWIRGFTSGALSGAQIAASVGCVGIILQIITLTGIGVKLPALVEAWSGGNVSLALLIVAVVSIILGCGVSTLAVYLIVAIVAAPVMLSLGVSMLSAHFFIFYFACFSMTTPPIGMASIIASKVAGAKYMPTAREAVRASIAGFILPFLFIWNPILLLQSAPSPLLAALGIIASLGIIVALQAVVTNSYISKMNLWKSVVIGLSFLTLVAYFITQINILLVVGIALVLFITVVQLIVRRKLSQQSVTKPET
jgi:TRAP transporter 4TM/12TM fusion protein